MNRIKELRKKAKLSQKVLAQKVFVDQTAVSQWECDRTQPSTVTAKALADLFGVSIDYLLGREENTTFRLPTMKEVPLLGTIACGEPITAEENIERYVNVIDSIDVDFALTCKGDSMINARIYDGDVVYIKQQSQVDNGTIAAVLIGDEATLKRVYYYPEKNMVILKAENKDYSDMIYQGEELNEIRILGKAVSFTSMVR